MEQTPPSWLDQSFLATVLQDGEDSGASVTVIDFSAKPAVAPGNNYSSHLYRVFVEYSLSEGGRQSTSLIIKAPIERGFIVEMSEKFDIFSREPVMYKTILPKMDEKAGQAFGPKSFFCPIKNGLSLKDLRAEGYTMGDRFVGLDFPHCKSVIEALAKFHASSVACYNDDPSLFDIVGLELFFSDDGLFPEKFTGTMQANFKAVGDLLKELDGCAKFADLVLSRGDDMWESGKRICAPRPNGLNVLNHGDLWINNIMFKNDDSGGITDVKLIDYQCTRRTSPALDLIHFTWSSANDDVRESRLKELYDIYRQTLNTTLEKLGCRERLSAEELQEELKSCSDWGLSTICGLLPMILAEPENTLNMEEMTSKDFESGKAEDTFKKLFHGKHYKARLPTVLRQFQSWIFT